MITARIQPSRFTDQITEDGTELTKLPYPFYASEDGSVLRQDLWFGNPYKVIGFQKDLAKQVIDLWWEDALQNPGQVVGMYLVTEDRTGLWNSHTNAVQDFEITTHITDGQNRTHQEN